MRGPTPVQHAATESIRVAVVDEDPFARRSLAECLDVADGFECIGHFAADSQVVRQVAERSPADVVVLGVHRPQSGEMQALNEILAVRPRTRVVLWTSREHTGLLDRALAAGAAGFLVKDCSLAALLGALRAAHLGVVVIAPEALAGLRERTIPAPPRLSGRERDVLALLCEGLSNAGIANALHVSPSTVKMSVGSLMRKFDAGSRLILVVKALNDHLLTHRPSLLS